jgi:predicted sulfurtransferase
MNDLGAAETCFVVVVLVVLPFSRRVDESPPFVGPSFVLVPPCTIPRGWRQVLQNCAVRRSPWFGVTMDRRIQILKTCLRAPRLRYDTITVSQRRREDGIIVWTMAAAPSSVTTQPSSDCGEFAQHEDYRIALYYLYTEIRQVESHVSFQQGLCQRLGLHGRIRVASEGMNGVLSGRRNDLQAYERELISEIEQWKHHQLTDDPNGLPTITAADLDLKYCRLRSDLPVDVQLFSTLLVKKSKTVIGLVDSPPPEAKKSRKSKRRHQAEESQQQSEAVWMRQVYERALAQLARQDGDNASKVAADEIAEQETLHIPHLKPDDWNRQLAELSQQPEQSVVLLDCRNVYESNVGHFRSKHAKTILTNTRKFSELPAVLLQQADELAESSHIFAYCTGGVRCERATVLLKELIRQRHPERKALPEIYQLCGGIQRYLEEQYQQPSCRGDLTAQTEGQACLFQGKNFVFDPRRLDPVHDGQVVGHCLVCQQSHDDYDNGHAPATDQAARCWNCRVLILVCNNCRPKVQCWGDNAATVSAGQPRMFCGGPNRLCWHRPPVQVLTDED